MPKYCGRPEKEYLTQLGIAVECFQEKLILKETEFSHKGKKKRNILEAEGITCAKAYCMDIRGD